jgi:hypothetical protein
MLSENEQIFSGRIRFTTDDTLIQLSENGQFVDLSGPAERQLMDEQLNHQRVSMLAHMGDRSLTGDPKSSLRVQSLIVAKIVPQTEIALIAYYISQSGHGGSALDNWLRAERESLGI